MSAHTQLADVAAAKDAAEKRAAFLERQEEAQGDTHPRPALQMQWEAVQTARSAQDKKIAELESAVRVAHVEVASLKKQLKEKDAARRSDEAALAQVRACVCMREGEAQGEVCVCVHEGEGEAALVQVRPSLAPHRRRSYLALCDDHGAGAII